ncbi:MAG TPA: hypothetical protein VK284_10895 [Streptosporangiaceae bacterium]|nr:hypothetical protein [Streptosporangiaceae bacterium]
MTAAGERKLRRALHDTLQALPPPPAPLEAIIRRGRRARLRRAGAAGGGVVLAGVIALAALTANGSARTAGPAPVPLGPVAPGGVIAHGTADGHQWRLAVQDIADPGYSCLPAITINGTDADPVYPRPDTGAVVALGPALPGVGFAFVQLPTDITGIVVNGDVSVPAVTVAACGLRYHVAGFAYSLARPLRVTVPNPPPGWPPVFTMPLVSTQPPGPHTTPESAGLWINTSSALGETASYDLALGTLPDGQDWVIKLQFGTGGDCYELIGSSSLGSAQMGYCGPVSTPDGPETITALPLGFPKPGTGATGYAVQVSPGTDLLLATLSNGSAEPAAFCVVDGRKYAAFIVPSPLRLAKLTWFDARGRAIASTTALPRYGYVQFRP